MRGYIPEVSNSIQDTAKAFEDEASSPVNLTTNVIVWAQVFPKWQSSIQGRNAPNVSEMAGEHAVDFGDQGVNDPVTDIYSDFDDWFETMDYWTSYDGENYGLPWFLEVRSYLYRMDLLSDAGINEAPRTWEDLISAGKTIRDQFGEEITPIGQPGGSDFATGQQMFDATHKFGGDFFQYENGQWNVTLDESDAVFGHLLQASLGQDHWDVAPRGWTGMAGSDVRALFQEGSAAMYQANGEPLRAAVNNPDEKDNQNIIEHTEVMTAPTGAVEERGNAAFMGGSVVSPFSENVTKNNAPDLKTEFLEYWMNPSTQQKVFTAAAPIFTPVRQSQTEAPPYGGENPTDLKQSWLDAMSEQAEKAVRYGVSGAKRCSPFLGSTEGNTTGYSQAFTSMIGAGNPPSQIQNMANQMRNTASDRLDYTLQEQSDGVSLDNLNDQAMAWADGSGPHQIWNPLE
ncbi:extracellular solute-binding protein [Halorhabdus amylolytica]|uniref:extracellular solute-binding protein n=1 Tax=Halorhabdus amylolytica TaxID=2559573 RepID=UPI0010A9D52F|nr:extracellular solute-binding protein [Halorhabdus amylolytica]